MAKGPENKFRDSSIRPFLKNCGARFFIKEAAALRGIPDIIGAINGRHFEIEVKAKEERYATGRLALQVHNLTEVIQDGGFGMVVYPSNFDLFVELFMNHAAGFTNRGQLLALLPKFKE